MRHNDLVQRALNLLTQRSEAGKKKAVLQPQKVLDLIPPVHSGSVIEWTRGDGSAHQGVVDLIHVDETGTRWAFVTLGENWAAVNLTFVKKSQA